MTLAAEAEQASFDLEARAPLPADAAPRDADGRRDWLRLLRSENVGPVTFIRLLRRFRSARAALDALPHLAAKGGRRDIRMATADEAAAELAAGEALGAQLICLGSPDYSRLLAQIDGPPPALWVRGAGAAVAQENAVAIVGARNASALGRRFADALARDLVDADVTVVSGLARGIDAAAHQGSIADGRSGRAVAVLAGGVDNIYPPENAGLYDALCGTGAVVSEMPIGWRPQARCFPRRNRIVAGLSRGVVVVEAAERSGSLITARLSVEHGREAMAVPGHPHDARAAGCNRLLRDGATLVRGVEDVLEAIRAPLSRPLAAASAAYEAVEDDDAPASAAPEPLGEGAGEGLGEALYALLSPSPIALDEALRALGVSPADAASALLELELAGRIERRPGGMICRAAMT